MKTPSTATYGGSSPRARLARNGLTAGAVLAGGTLLVTGFAGGASAATAGKPQPPQPTAAASKGQAATQKASDAHVTIAPGDQATGVGIAPGGSSVTVPHGTLTHVTMVNKSTGAKVPGAFSADKRSWTPHAPLSHSTHYAISASATASGGGGPKVAHSSFTTASPAGEFTGKYTPGNGSTVGVGMPVSITFDKSITHKADVQSHITVDSSSGQHVVGHWFGDRRLDFRPSGYWKPGSTITLKLGLNKVTGANGITGAQDQSATFSIGHSQISTVDAANQKMKVVRDGKLIKTIPVSTGSPGHPTYNGKMTISQKYQKLRMDGSTVGFKNQYDIPDVPHAMRLTTSGTFIHGNYWSKPSVFGATPKSHGCVGLQDVQHGDNPNTNAAWFFHHSITGDVVVVKHSPGHTVAPDNGLNDWNMPWKQWTASSSAS